MLLSVSPHMTKVFETIMKDILNHGIVTQGIPSFFVSKTSFINLMTAIDSTSDQNTMCRVI